MAALAEELLAAQRELSNEARNTWWPRRSPAMPRPERARAVALWDAQKKELRNAVDSPVFRLLRCHAARERCAAEIRGLRGSLSEAHRGERLPGGAHRHRGRRTARKNQLRETVHQCPGRTGGAARLGGRPPLASWRGARRAQRSNSGGRCGWVRPKRT